jgi:hypothetical protein
MRSIVVRGLRESLPGGYRGTVFVLVVLVALVITTTTLCFATLSVALGHALVAPWQ